MKGLKKIPTPEPPYEQVLGGSCSLWRGAHAGAGDLGKLLPMGDPCWSSLLLTDGPDACGSSF